MSHTVDIPLPLCGEHQWLLAVLHRSLHDLTPNAPALDRRARVAFFSNADGWLEALCDMAGLEHPRVQALARSRYPDGGEGSALHPKRFSMRGRVWHAGHC